MLVIVLQIDACLLANSICRCYSLPSSIGIAAAGQELHKALADSFWPGTAWEMLGWPVTGLGFSIFAKG